jgi:hypothetical protein
VGKRFFFGVSSAARNKGDFEEMYLREGVGSVSDQKASLTDSTCAARNNGT